MKNITSFFTRIAIIMLSIIAINNTLISARVQIEFDENPINIKRKEKEAIESWSNLKPNAFAMRLNKIYIFEEETENYLSECSKHRCFANRRKNPLVRDTSEEKTVKTAFAMFNPEECTQDNPLVFVSFGSGKLLQDFVILRKLIAKGYKYLEIHLIDGIYNFTPDAIPNYIKRFWSYLNTYEEERLISGFSVFTYESYNDFIEHNVNFNLLIGIDTEENQITRDILPIIIKRKQNNDPFFVLTLDGEDGAQKGILNIIKYKNDYIEGEKIFFLHGKSIKIDFKNLNYPNMYYNLYNYLKTLGNRYLARSYNFYFKMCDNIANLRFTDWQFYILVNKYGIILPRFRTMGIFKQFIYNKNLFQNNELPDYLREDYEQMRNKQEIVEERLREAIPLIEGSRNLNIELSKKQFIENQEIIDITSKIKEEQEELHRQNINQIQARLRNLTNMTNQEIDDMPQRIVDAAHLQENTDRTHSYNIQTLTNILGKNTINNFTNQLIRTNTRFKKKQNRLILNQNAYEALFNIIKNYLTRQQRKQNINQISARLRNLTNVTNREIDNMPKKIMRAAYMRNNNDGTHSYNFQTLTNIFGIGNINRILNKYNNAMRSPIKIESQQRLILDDIEYEALLNIIKEDIIQYKNKATRKPNQRKRQTSRRRN